MRTELCDPFGIRYPIFVFTPSEKAAAAVSKAGGLAVLGCVRFNEDDDLENVLQLDGRPKPYGVDMVMPAKIPTKGTAVDIDKLIPQQHRDFVAKTLAALAFRHRLTTRGETRVCSAGCIRSPAHTSRGR